MIERTEHNANVDVLYSLRITRKKKYELERETGLYMPKANYNYIDNELPVSKLYERERCTW